MLVILYNFPKRPNSTKEPTPNDATALKLNNVELKEESSFLNPVLLIRPDPIPGQVFSPTQYNYCAIPYWMRYYYIRDWVWKNGVWEVSMSVDVLASFKDVIGETDAYVLRSATVFDGNIVDSSYATKSNIQMTRVGVASAWNGVAPSGGSYILGVLNYQKTNKVGAVSYYALNATQFGNVMNYLMTDQIFWSSSIDEVSEGLYKAIADPCQYIVSCMWFPFSSSAFGNSNTTVKVGYWDTGVSAVIMSTLAEKTYVTATIPDHPQISRGQYLNREPYTRVTLYIPPFGEIPIDTTYLAFGNYLYSACVVDHVTGLATLRLAISPSNTNTNEYNIFTERTGQLGVPIQISQILQDYVGSAHNASGVSNTILEKAWDAVAYLSAGVLDFASQLGGGSKKTSTVGANGSFIECLLSPVLIVEHFLLTDENREEFGRPLCQTRRINSLLGYIRCAEDDHSFPCTIEEKTMINDYLKDGFFFE